MLSNQQSLMVESTLRELLNRNKTEKAQSKTVLAFLFYHINGVEEGLDSLKMLHENNFRIRVCPDPEIFQHYHVADLAERMGFNDWISPKELECQKEHFEHFFIPVLPFSMAGDFMHFNDRNASVRIVLWALMKGKKVSAFTAGADPHHPIWVESGMNHGTAFLKHELKKNLHYIKGYGIQCIDNADDVLHHFVRSFHQATKRVITAQIMKEHAETGQRSISVEQGTIITPLARDIAREHQIEIDEKRGNSHGTWNRGWQSDSNEKR